MPSYPPARSGGRLVRGRGSIYPISNGTWRGAAIVTDPSSGRRIRRYLSGPSADSVLAKMTDLQSEVARGVTSAGPKLKTGTYLARWIDGLGSTVRPATERGYRQHVEGYWIPLIGSVPLARLAPRDVEQAMATLTARGLSATTVRGARATLRRCLGRAIRDGLIARNPASLATPPRQPHREIEYLPIPAIRRVIEATAGDELGAAWTIALTTGVRLGELAALSWSDVGPDDLTLTVRRALARDASGGWSLGETKTARSRRTVPLPAAARAALADQRGRQDAARARAGNAWQGRRDDLIFTDSLGRPIPPGTLSKAWRETADRLGVDVPFRALRHSAATAWLTSGVPLVLVSEALGHTGVSITVAHYSAIAPELRQATASAMDRALGGEP